MKYTAGQAATATGLSTATITRAIKKGKISAVKDGAGAWSIDPSELHRVFPPLAVMQGMQDQMQREVISAASMPLQFELERLQERLKGMEALATDRADQIADLRTRLDAEAQERRRLTALLAHQTDKPATIPEDPPARKWPWWSWSR